MGGFGLAVACPPSLAEAWLGASQQLSSAAFWRQHKQVFLSHPELNVFYAPTLLLSGNSKEEAEEHHNRLGFLALLLRPFQISVSIPSHRDFTLALPLPFPLLFPTCRRSLYSFSCTGVK